MKRWIVLTAAAAFTAGAALADQHTEAPKPGPDTRKLEAFAGKWKGESTVQAGPWGPGGKMTSDQECKWFAGGFQLVCTEDGTGFLGKTRGQFALGWSPEDKYYKYMGYDSTGMMGWATGTLAGNVWSWSGEDKMGGKMVKSKYTITLTSPTTQTFKWEASDDGGKTWKTLAEGKSTRQ